MDPVEGKIYKHYGEEKVMKAVEAQAYLTGQQQIHQTDQQQESRQVQKSDRDYLKDLLYGLYPQGSVYSDTYPIDPPAEPTEEELASLSMNARKARQKQYERDLEVYKERQQNWTSIVAERKANEIALAKKIEKANSPAERQRRSTKEMILRNPSVQEALSAVNQLRDPIERNRAMQEFLKTAGKALIDNPDFSEELRGKYTLPANYSNLTTGLRVALAEQQPGNEATIQALTSTSRSIETQFNELEERDFLNRVISFEISDIFREEYETLPEFRKAEVSLQEECQEDLGNVMRAYDEFEAVFKEQTGLSDKVISRYLKEEKLDEFRLSVRNLLKEGHTQDEAEEIVLTTMKENMQKMCKAFSMDSNLEGAKCTDEIAEKSGFASYHQVFSMSEATKIASESNGFLCAVQYGADSRFAELKPSLPEEIPVTYQEKGETKNVRLRESYNTFFRDAVKLLVDENGNLRDDAEDYAAKISSFLANDPGVSLKEIDQSSCLQMKAIIERSLGTVGELFRSQDVKFVNSIKRLREGENISRELDTINSFETQEEKLTYIKDSESPVITLIRDSKIPVIENGDYKYDKDGNLETRNPSFEEIIATLTESQKECISAKEAYRKIRNLDPNDSEIPLFNACSGNAAFINSIRLMQSGQDSRHAPRPLQYHTIGSYANLLIDNDLTEQKKAEQEVLQRQLKADCLQRVLDNYENLLCSKPKDVQERLLQKTVEKEKPGENGSAPKKVKESEKISAKETKDILKAYLAKLKGPDAAEDKVADEIYLRFVNMFYKYEFHQAAEIMNTGGTTYTTEGLARETTQFVSEAFTYRSVIGAYHGEKKNRIPPSLSGMEEFYRLDNPFACSSIATLKLKLMDGLNLGE